jgi:3-deoxy-manno-octulosonate cytidylyltransferase (CMP-KDO synthetase)
MALRVLGVIPARLASTRLPRKVLRPLAGRPLLAWVYEAARRAPALDEVLVATDAEEVAGVCRGLGIPAVMTSASHPSGTDRVWEVAQTHAADVYVNVQGDEPFVTAGHVGLLVEPFQTSADTQVSTLCIRATPDEVDARQVNKVVFGAGGRALYFSKYGIPFDRDNRGAVRYKHVGLYAYRKDALEVFHRLPPSTLERTEGLEQLRFLEHGVPITVRETTEPTIGIDTEEDLRAAEARLALRPG